MLQGNSSTARWPVQPVCLLELAQSRQGAAPAAVHAPCDTRTNCLPALSLFPTCISSLLGHPCRTTSFFRAAYAACWATQHSRKRTAAAVSEAVVQAGAALLPLAANTASPAARSKHSPTLTIIHRYLALAAAGRILNICVTAYDTREPSRLLNYLTAPNVRGFGGRCAYGCCCGCAVVVVPRRGGVRGNAILHVRLLQERLFGATAAGPPAGSRRHPCPAVLASC